MSARVDGGGGGAPAADRRSSVSCGGRVSWDPSCHRGAVGARPRRCQWGLDSIPCCMQCRTERSESSEHRAPGLSIFHCDSPPQCRQRPQLCLKSQHLSMQLLSLTVLTSTRGALYRETLAERASVEERNGLNSV